MYNEDFYCFILLNMCILEFFKMGRGIVKKCARKWHNEWKSSSVFLINLKDRFRGGNIFGKAFNLWKTAKRQCVCSDCLQICLKKRSFTKRLPNNYRHLPPLQKVISYCYVFAFKKLENGASTKSFLFCL